MLIDTENERCCKCGFSLRKPRPFHEPNSLGIILQFIIGTDPFGNKLVCHSECVNKPPGPPGEGPIIEGTCVEIKRERIKDGTL